MNALTPEEKKALKDFIFVTPETHTEIQCTCPDCGRVFSRWLQNHLVECPLDRMMHEQTTDCGPCIEELLEEQEWEEEMAELREEHNGGE